MKKVMYAVLAIFTLALLMGGTCNRARKAPVDLSSKTDQPISPVDRTIDSSKLPKTNAEQPTNEDFSKAYFDFDKYNIRPDAASALEFNAGILKKYPDLRIMVEGHCDERGTVEYNLALGERRATAVRDYLASLGISTTRMETISYGKERPVDLGHDETAWQKNRRAEFKILK